MRYRFVLGSPGRFDVLCLQGHLSEFVRKGLQGLEVCELNLEARVVYIHPRFLMSLSKYFRRVSRLAAAVLATAECCRARVVVSMENFDLNQHNPGGETLLGELARARPDLKIFSIQHGQELRRFPSGRPTKNVTLLCWGDWVAENFPRMGRNEASYVSVGALVDGLYREMKPLKIEKDVDLCFISTIKGPEWWGASIAERRAGFERLTEYLREFAQRSKLTPHIALTIDRDQNEGDEVGHERRWFLERLGKNIRFTEPSLIFGGAGVREEAARTPSYVKERYGTYYLCDRSRVTLGMTSSVLWESFGRGNKILAVNLTDNEIYDFPKAGIWTMRQPTYEEFEVRLKMLLELTQAEWDQQSMTARRDLMHYDPQCPPHLAINREIWRALARR